MSQTETAALVDEKLVATANSLITSSEVFWGLLRRAGVVPAAGPPPRGDEPFTVTKSRKDSMQFVSGEPKEDELDNFSQLEEGKPFVDLSFSPQAASLVDLVVAGKATKKTFGERFIAAHFTEIKLDNLRITTLDPGICLLKNVTVLSLANNRLRTADHLPPSLISLCLNNNLLEDAPMVVSTLRHLGLAHNRISRVDLLVLGKPLMLQSLDLSNNHICALENISPLGKLKNLKFLFLVGNPVDLLRDTRIRQITALHPALSHLNGIEISEAEKATASTNRKGQTPTDSERPQSLEPADAPENATMTINIGTFRVANPRPEVDGEEPSELPPVRFSVEFSLPLEKRIQASQVTVWAPEIDFNLAFTLSLSVSPETRDYIRAPAGIALRIQRHDPIPPPPPPEPTPEEIQAQLAAAEEAKKKGGKKAAAPAAAKDAKGKPAAKGAKVEVPEEIVYDPAGYTVSRFGTVRVPLDLLLKGFDIREEFPVSPYTISDENVVMISENPDSKSKKRLSHGSDATKLGATLAVKISLNPVTATTPGGEAPAVPSGATATTTSSNKSK